MSQRSGADHLIATLEETGCRCVFGVPGTQTVPVFEALRKSRIRTVLAASEASAAFMAGGWARVTGQPGVCLTIPGPGFAWSLAGLAEALLDSIPLLAVTGAPPERPGRRFRQQELDQAAIATPLVKQVFEAKRPGEIAPLTRAALAAALRGEPGPVLLQLTDRAIQDVEPDSPGPPDNGGPSAPDFRALRSRLAAARRPVLLVGQGACRSAAEIRRLVESLGAPVLTTPAGRGILPEDHPLALGFDPLAGSVVAVNGLLSEADLILVLGAKLGHNGTAGFALALPSDRLLQVDASDQVPGSNYPVSLAWVSPVHDALHALLEPPPGPSSWSPDVVASWRGRIRTLERSPPEPSIAGSRDRDPGAFFAALRRALPRNGRLVLDSGLHQVMARRHFPVLAPGGLLFPSDLQSMGFGVPTAVGAVLGDPGRRVVALVGDGGFAMTGLELLSAVREGLTLVVLVFLDGVLGQIRLQQIQEYGAPHAVDLGPLDVGGIATAVGARYFEVGDDVESTLAAALRESGVTVIGIPLGDSGRIRSMASAARVRERIRRLAGPGLIRWIKRVLQRGS